MNSKECEIQLKELIEAWDLNEALLNQTDINAIKHLMLENQIQQDTIKTQKLVIENLSERINRAIHKIQLLQMDGEVTIRDLGLIVRDLKGDNNEHI